MNKDNKSTIETIVKTPGKCLISGGYLILNPNKKGLVINIDSYFKVKSTISISILQESSSSLSNPWELSSQITISVTSSYLNEQYVYSVLLNQLSAEVTQFKMSNSNKWIENSIKASFYSFFCFNNRIDINYLKSHLSNNTITIVIDSDYRFFSFDKNNEKKDIKTGLGSSSALVVSICSNLISLLYKITNQLPVIIQEKSIKEIDITIQSVITYASILSNNISQDKIGSGFDIMSCLFGNQIFFQCKLSLPSFNSFHLTDSIIAEAKTFIEEYQEKYLSKLCLLGKMPSLFKCALISIEHGSDTRIMVKKVLSWAESNKTNELFDDKLFMELDEINNKIVEVIFKDIFNSDIISINHINVLKDKVNILKQLCIKYREKIKEISKETTVDIEPLILSPLLDNLIESENIIYAICPGAGGFDSIFILGIEEKNEDVFLNRIASSVNIFNSKYKNKKYKAYIIKSSIVNNGTKLLC